jgi:hypothetical protein
MILTTQQNRNIVSGDIKTVDMNISQDAEVQAHIIKILTETYKYPIQSIIRENFCNHFDSHIEAGKPDELVNVKIIRENGNYFLETSDTGLGMTEEAFYKYYMGIGESTKRNKSNLIGGFGAGCKAALSYTDNYEVICRKDGIECKFLVYKGEDRPTCTRLYSDSTDKENGVIVKVPIDYYDFNDFVYGIKTQLCYFPTANIDILGDTSYNNSKIFENDIMIWSELNPISELRICFNGCNYPIDWSLLKINKIYVPVAIKLAIDCGVIPEFNRESLRYDKFTKELIINKIKELADYFVGKYNEQMVNEYSVLEAFRKYKNIHYFRLFDIDVDIKQLEKYSSIPISEMKVTGLKYRTISQYDNLFYNIDDHFESFRLGTSSISDKIRNYANPELIYVDEKPRGYAKKYLYSKYRNPSFFKKKQLKRNLKFYINHLSIRDIPKSEWRNRILEYLYFENQILSCIQDETNLKEKQEFKDYCANNKITRRSYSGSSKNTYKQLNKEKGDITIQVLSLSKRADYKLIKHAYKVNKLNNLHSSSKSLHLYFREDQIETAEFYYNCFKDKITVCVIGKNELKKLPKTYNFMTETEFKSTSIFKRAMTAIKFQDLLTELADMEDNHTLIEHGFKAIKEERDTLQKYVTANYVSGLNKNLIINMANENKLYDYSLDDKYMKIKNLMSKYGFINSVVGYGDEQSNQKLINTLFLLKSKSGVNFDEFNIVVTPKVIQEEVLETV